MVNELLYADDLILMSETMEDVKKRFWNSKDLKVNTRKTKVMVSGSKGKLFNSVRKENYSIHGQFSVVHKMWKLGSWQMCKNKESYRKVGNAFCLLEM